MLLDRNRGASFISILLLGAGMFGVFLFLTYYLQQSLGYTPIETGLAFLPMIAGLMLASTMATTVLIPRLGPKPIVPLGMGLPAAGMVWLTGLGPTSSYAGDIMPPPIVAGLGLGLVKAPAMALATEEVRAEDAGGRLGGREHDAADRGLAGYGAAEHPVHQRGHELHRRQESQGPRGARPGRP